MQHVPAAQRMSCPSMHELLTSSTSSAVFPAPVGVMPVAAEPRGGSTCVFMTNGPCCTTGSPMGRPAASRKRSPSTPALAATWSPGPSTSACTHRRTLLPGKQPNRTQPRVRPRQQCSMLSQL